MAGPKTNPQNAALLRQMRHLNAATAVAAYVTPGGTAGQVYTKVSSTDYDAHWAASAGGATGPAGPTGPAGAAGATGPGVPTGGAAGQTLAKNSASDYDTRWTDGIAWMPVVNPATDVRPTAQYVMWVGGTTKPTNMATGDLWVKG
jgi:hypothetical protein